MYELIRYFLKTIEYFFTNLNQNCCITLKVMVPKKKKKCLMHILKAHLDQFLVLE